MIIHGFITSVANMLQSLLEPFRLSSLIEVLIQYFLYFTLISVMNTNTTHAIHILTGSTIVLVIVIKVSGRSNIVLNRTFVSF